MGPLSNPLKRSMKRTQRFCRIAIPGKALLHKALLRLFALTRQCIHLKGIYPGRLIA